MCVAWLGLGRRLPSVPRCCGRSARPGASRSCSARPCSAATRTATWPRESCCTSGSTRTRWPPSRSRRTATRSCSAPCRRSGATRPRRTGRCSSELVSLFAGVAASHLVAGVLLVPAARSDRRRADRRVRAAARARARGRSSAGRVACGAQPARAPAAGRRRPQRRVDGGADGRRGGAGARAAARWRESRCARSPRRSSSRPRPRGVHRRRVRRGSTGGSLARAAVVLVAVLAVVTLVVGVGFDWITTGVFSTPQKVRLAITPSTGRRLHDRLDAARLRRVRATRARSSRRSPACSVP